jgi:hypothetical protein
MIIRMHPLLFAGFVAWLSGVAAGDAPPVVPNAGSDAVQFTIRICEGKDKLKFWFNDEASERWSTCPLPVPNVPVFIVSDSGQRVESKTGQDGIATVPALNLQPQEKFRMAMACTTHNCFSLRGLFITSPDVVGMDIRSGANMMYAETVARVSTQN